MRAVTIGGAGILAIIGLKIVMGLLGMVMGLISFLVFTVLPLALIGFLVYKAFGWFGSNGSAEEAS
ncbi:MAG: hypothetical protein ABFS34_14290 [Gemmatimonadota bacterium]